MATLPEANEFSPGIVKLGRVLALVSENAGSRDAIAEAIRREYFSTSAGKQAEPGMRLKVQLIRATNVLIGMKGYRLYDPASCQLTEVGLHLLQVPAETERLNQLAAHILKNCRGLDVLQAIESLRKRGDQVSKDSLQAELENNFGHKLPRATTHHTRLLQWLREAGVVDSQYVIDDERVRTLAGLDPSTKTGLEALSVPQVAFLTALKALASVQGAGPFPVGLVLTHAVLQYGKVFKADQIRKEVLRPLEEEGWIELSRVGSGRGGKSGDVAPTARLLAIPAEALRASSPGAIPPELRDRLSARLEDIAADLASDDTYTKGLALELLALRAVSDLGLAPVGFRTRGVETGGAEVDLIAEGAHLHFSRWLIQCKNTGTVQVADLAKEIGMAVLLKAHVVVMITTGRFSSTVIELAREIGGTTALQVVLVSKDPVNAYLRQGAAPLLSFFRTSAGEALRLKRSQVARTLGENAGGSGSAAPVASSEE